MFGKDKEKKSFFERLTGTINMEDDSEETVSGKSPESKGKAGWLEEEAEEGQLAVDVHQTPDALHIKAMVAGVRPEDLDVTITRDMVTIRGKREEMRTVNNEDFFLKELYWGSFSRTIMLPAEVEPEEADASEKHGLLILKLPKIDKAKQTKVRVKSNS